ncbi:MAG: galactokinase [Bergeyella sp.]
MNTQDLLLNTQHHFKKQFGETPETNVLSPGRINLIGEHVDNYDGFVLPAAIDMYIAFSARKNNRNDIRIYAADINESVSIKIDENHQPSENLWQNYFLGILQNIKKESKFSTGIDVAFSSNLPVGAGLSSSAALSCGFAFLLNHVYNLGFSGKEIALMGQWTEHNFAGVKCGIMDQFASVFGKKNQVILLDCMTAEYQYYNLDFGSYALLLLDSGVKHTHLTSGYNDRRADVLRGIEILKKHFPDYQTLRTVSTEQIESLKQELTEKECQRLIYVVKEIARVKDAVKALEKNAHTEFGKLMYQTHLGLSREYEVSCEELDFLVEEIMKKEGVIGSRMMGGGFGGCSISLIRKDRLQTVTEEIKTSYRQKFGIELKDYSVNISNGTQTVENEFI